MGLAFATWKYVLTEELEFPLKRIPLAHETETNTPNCYGMAKIVYHLGFRDAEQATVKNRIQKSIDQVEKFAEVNHIQLVEDPVENYYAYTLYCGDQTRTVKSVLTGEDLTKECQDFYGLK